MAVGRVGVWVSGWGCFLGGAARRAIAAVASGWREAPTHCPATHEHCRSQAGHASCTAHPLTSLHSMLALRYYQYAVTGPLYVLSWGEAAAYHLTTLAALWAMWQLLLCAASLLGLLTGVNGA